MPRTLARLTYKKPPVPITRARLEATRPHHEARLEKRVEKYVVRQSNPKHIRLQTVVNPKTKPQASGQSALRPIKPFTLGDHVDPEGKAPHGQIIYVFRNFKTNQIVYSLQELLDNHHLAQLPFIGKHSKPPTFRPDEWTPHCVVIFPTPEQGHNAYRKLREFRKLHELAWEKTNPEWLRLPLKQRMYKIMDQRENMSADLAEVLRIQADAGVLMKEAYDEQQRKANEFMDKRWPQLDALANASETKEKVADNVKWLEHQIMSMTGKLKMKHNQNEAAQKRLSAAKAALDTRLSKVTYAKRKAQQFKKVQDELNEKAKFANTPNAEAYLEHMKAEEQSLLSRLENPNPSNPNDSPAQIQRLLERQRKGIAALEEAFEYKTQAEARDHHIARSVLPRALRKVLPTPFTLTNISIKWADILDAGYAAERWPEAIEHEVLGLNDIRTTVTYLSAEDYEIEKNGEVSKILSALRNRRVGTHDSENDNIHPYLEDEPLPEKKQEKTGVLKYLPNVKNPFKSATA